MKKMDWKLKDILMVGLVGVLFSFLYLGMVYVGTGLTAALTPFGLGPLGYEPIYGVWYMAGIFAVYVIQKPGVGIVAEMLASLLEVLMGNMFGPRVFLTGAIQGFGTELGFGLFRYQRYDMRSVLVSSLTTTVFSFLWNIYTSSYWALELWLVLLMLGVRIVSALIIGGIVTKLLADGLAKSGVLKGYALGRKYNNFDEAV